MLPHACGLFEVVTIGGAGEAAGAAEGGRTRGGSLGRVLDIRSLQKHITTTIYHTAHNWEETAAELP